MFCVPAFILCGFEHSIADAFTLRMRGCFPPRRLYFCLLWRREMPSVRCFSAPCSSFPAAHSEKSRHKLKMSILKNKHRKSRSFRCFFKLYRFGREIGNAMLNKTNRNRGARGVFGNKRGDFAKRPKLGFGVLLAYFHAVAFL